MVNHTQETGQIQYTTQFIENGFKKKNITGGVIHRILLIKSTTLLMTKVLRR